jgi:hypothetical protein
MDLLLHEEEESVRAIDLIDEVRGAGARTVVTCREQEADALDRQFETVRLGTYNEAELSGAIEQHVLAFCPDAPPRPIEEKVAVMLRLASRGLGMTEVCHHSYAQAIFAITGPRSTRSPVLRAPGMTPPRTQQPRRPRQPV